MAKKDTDEGLRPSGRGEVRTALIAAANELFGLKGPDAVSVRDVARHANVNHALLHRHFGSKEQLLKDVMAEHAAHFVSSSSKSDSAEGTLRAMFDLMADNPAFVRIIAHLLLSGHSPEEFVSDEGGARLLVKLRVQKSAEREDEAKLAAAASTAFTMGWLFFESFVLRAVDYDGDARDARQYVQHTIQRLLLTP